MSDFVVPRFISKHIIYKGADGFIYDEDHPEYDCLKPEFSGTTFCVDCWICDEEGNVHPDYNVAGVPVYVDCIGEPVADDTSLSEED